MTYKGELDSHFRGDDIQRPALYKRLRVLPAPYVSFLRKQESRLLCIRAHVIPAQAGEGVIPAQAGIQTCSRASGNPGNRDFYFFLDSCLRGNDTLALSRKGKRHSPHSHTLLFGAKFLEGLEQFLAGAWIAG